LAVAVAQAQNLHFEGVLVAAQTQNIRFLAQDKTQQAVGKELVTVKLELSAVWAAVNRRVLASSYITEVLHFYSLFEIKIAHLFLCD
jgi:hypothetical protein